MGGKRHLLSTVVAKLIGHKPAAAGGQLYKQREREKKKKGKEKTPTDLPEREANTEAEPKGVGRVPDNNI